MGWTSHSAAEIAGRLQISEASARVIDFSQPSGWLRAALEKGGIAVSGERTDIPRQVRLDLWPWSATGWPARRAAAWWKTTWPTARPAGPRPPERLFSLPPSDERVLAALRRRLLAGGLLLAGLGCLVGLAITYSANMFYNLILLPLAGVPWGSGPGQALALGALGLLWVDLTSGCFSAPAGNC